MVINPDDKEILDAIEDYGEWFETIRKMYPGEESYEVPRRFIKVGEPPEENPLLDKYLINYLAAQELLGED